MDSKVKILIILSCLAVCRGRSLVQMRDRRQTLSVDKSPNNNEIETLRVDGNLLRNGDHSLDAHGQISRALGPNGYRVGGGLDYTGPKTSTSLNVNQIPGIGTNVDATLNANILRSEDRRSSLDAYINHKRFVDHDDPGRTNLGVRGNANLWNSDDREHSVDAFANYNRELNSGQSNYGGGLRYKWEFGKWVIEAKNIWLEWIKM